MIIVGINDELQVVQRYIDERYYLYEFVVVVDVHLIVPQEL
jgi:hypothetical protein